MRGQQVAMATVHNNSGNIFLNYQGILSATYLAEAWQRNVAADLVGRIFFLKYAPVPGTKVPGILITGVADLIYCSNMKLLEYSRRSRG